MHNRRHDPAAYAQKNDFSNVKSHLNPELSKAHINDSYRQYDSKVPPYDNRPNYDLLHRKHKQLLTIRQMEGGACPPPPVDQLDLSIRSQPWDDRETFRYEA